MTSESLPTTSDFFEIAARHQLLEGDPAQHRREAEVAGNSAEEYVLRNGLLDAIAVDIVETLRRPSEAIPGYEIENVLGRGAMGVVYRARQRNLDRVVALKTILVNQMSAPSSLERFEQEGRTIGKLRHPNIIAAYDLGRHAGRLFLAMEFIEGSDLAERLERRGPIDEVTAWHLARQAAAGLDHAAGEGVVHRDVKPANLMLVEPPVGYPFPVGIPMVKIADFGLALLSDAEPNARLTTENTTLGSPYYMAPEQFRSSQVDHVADLYALGASVYHALAGRPPFAGMGVAQIIGAKFQDRPASLADLRPGLAKVTYELVDRMLEPDPEKRIRSYTRLIAEIDEIIGGQHGTMRIGVTETPTDPGAATQIERPTVVDHGARTTTSQPAAATAFVPTAITNADLPVATEDVIPSSAETMVGTATGTATGTESRTSVPNWVLWAALLLSVGGATFIAWYPWSPTPADDGTTTTNADEPAPTEPYGMSVHLFNGFNTSGWNRRQGNWIAPVGEGVLAGTDGTIGRSLIRRDEESGEPRAVRWYRLELLFQPRSDDRRGVQELHFGVTGSKPDPNGPRHVLRRTADGLEIGRRATDDAPFEQGEDGLVRAPGDLAVAVVLERNPNGWFLSARGTALPGIPLGESDVPEFRLKADDGTAWFSDLVLTELRPVNGD